MHIIRVIKKVRCGMTREDAISWIEKIIKKYIHGGDDAFDAERKEALQMAISALEQEPCETSTDEPMTMVYPTIFCDDAISRAELIKHFAKWKDEMAYSFGEEYSGVDVLGNAIQIIKYRPSVQPSRKKGEWITERGVTGPYVCSECGIFHNGKHRNFCPECGADMRGDT